MYFFNFFLLGLLGWLEFDKGMTVLQNGYKDGMTDSCIGITIMGIALMAICFKVFPSMRL